MKHDFYVSRQLNITELLARASVAIKKPIIEKSHTQLSHTKAVYYKNWI